MNDISSTKSLTVGDFRADLSLEISYYKHNLNVVYIEVQPSVIACSVFHIYICQQHIVINFVPEETLI